MPVKKKKSSKKRSPMMEQYWSIKEGHPDKLVFFRMGDFYELFYQDAQTAAPLLGLTLTSRNKKSGDETPMCGMPHHSVAVHINKLLKAGHKVALCDQVEDPKQAKGIVRREITRILTPGMVYNPDELDSEKPHYLASWDKDSCLSFLEPTTGECFYYSDLGEKDFTRILQSLNPVEIVLPPEVIENERSEVAPKLYGEVVWSSYSDNKSSGSKSQASESDPKSAQRLISYGRMMQGEGLIQTLKPFEQRKFKNRLKLTHRVQRHLEVFKTYGGEKEGTLYSAINRTKTAGGARTLRQWLQFPLGEPEGINQRLDRIEKWMGKLSILKEVRKKLGGIGDLERRFGKIAQPQVHPRDLVQLGLALGQTLEILPLIDDGHESHWDGLVTLVDRLRDSFLDELPKNFREGGFLKDGIFKELDDLIQGAKEAQKSVLALEAKERKVTGITSLKVRYNNVFGYFIEVTNTHKSKVPLERYRRKQTLTNAERYVTEELDLLEQKVLAAKTKRAELELTYFESLKKEVLAAAQDVLSVAHVLAETDVLTSLAWLALESDFVRPTWNDDGFFQIEGGRHPVVEQSLGSEFVENDIELQRGRAALLTGPNMAGKSTIMRQLAITVLLGQMGSMVPARKANLSLVDQIFTRIGASDSLTEGLSTFMVEMKEAAEMLNESSHQSLVILDEVGRGTSTGDGVALARSILEYFILETGPSLLFATHYHELTVLAQEFPEKVINFHMGIDHSGAKARFTYQLEDGPSGKSYGVQVAAMAGLPDVVIERAKELLTQNWAGGHDNDVSSDVSRADMSGVDANRTGTTRAGISGAVVSGITPNKAIDASAKKGFEKGSGSKKDQAGALSREPNVKPIDSPDYSWQKLVSTPSDSSSWTVMSGDDSSSEDQMDFFGDNLPAPREVIMVERSPKEKAALEDLRKISIQEMTPLDALNKISQWQRELS